MSILYGPFSQILPMTDLPAAGPLKDEDLVIIEDGGLLVKDGQIQKIGSFKDLQKETSRVESPPRPSVCLPGLVDAHTHICFGGSRARDYAARLNGKTYQEIAAAGGGILDTVRKTREANQEDLERGILKRAERLFSRGVTTAEVKSGYGLSLEAELKMLRAIKAAQERSSVDLISTCLAAHTLPWEFDSHRDYLDEMEKTLLPQVWKESLSKRVDIFIEEGAFSAENSRPYLTAAKKMGFSLCIHADQFSPGGSKLAAELGAISAEHLEVSSDDEIRLMKKAGIIPVVLPGASLGLGIPFSPARKLLDAGLPLVIASDWNPGSAPMGDLLTQTALMGASEKLSMAESWAAITVRAAKCLQLRDRGSLAPGQRADFVAFPGDDYREILYQQGMLNPGWTKSAKSQELVKR